MPLFSYRMAAHNGVVTEGRLAAADERQLATILENRGGILIESKPVSTTAWKARRTTRRELITFASHLNTALGAGLPITESIRGFAATLGDKMLAGLIDDVAQSIENGASCAGAMGRYPNAFPPLFRQMVATGEESGHLEEVFDGLSGFLEWQDGVLKDLRQATVYPAALITLVMALVVFLLTFVLPRFTTLFAAGGAKIPVAARILTAVGTLFSSGWPFILAGALGLWAAWLFMRRSPAGALWLDRQLLRIPLFGNVILNIRISQFCYSLKLLLDAGVDILRAFELTQDVVGNRHMTRQIALVRERLMSGQGLTPALRASGMFPNLVIQMIAMGEESGTLSVALGRIHSYLQREVKTGIKFAFSILEPAIVVFMGVVVGGIAVTVFYTLYTMIMSLGHH